VASVQDFTISCLGSFSSQPNQPPVLPPKIYAANRDALALD